jgi:uncharacterized membrane-anchored protein YitT (DUF2179 family)
MTKNDDQAIPAEQKKDHKHLIKIPNSISAEIKRAILTIFFTFLYGVSVSWFLDTSIIPLYAGGMAGIAQLIRDITNLAADKEVLGQTFLGIWVFLVNIPLLVLGWKGVSKRFAIYTFISVLVQTTVLSFIPKIDIGDLSNDTLVLAVIGGAISGIGIGGALKFGVSTGGFDVISQFFSLKKGISVGLIGSTVNISIAIIGGLIMIFGGKKGIAFQVISYTILRIIITDLVLDSIHKSYRFLKVEIFTPEYESISRNIIETVHRGVTMVNIQGAYTKKTQYSCVTIVSGYELPLIKKIIKEIDPKAFVVVSSVKSVSGNFLKKTII